MAGIRLVLHKTLNQLNKDARRVFVRLAWQVKDTAFRVWLLKCMPEYTVYFNHKMETIKKLKFMSKKSSESKQRLMIENRTENLDSKILEDCRSCFEILSAKVKHNYKYRNLEHTEAWSEFNEYVKKRLYF